MSFAECSRLTANGWTNPHLSMWHRDLLQSVSNLYHSYGTFSETKKATLHLLSIFWCGVIHKVFESNSDRVLFDAPKSHSDFLTVCSLTYKKFIRQMRRSVTWPLKPVTQTDGHSVFHFFFFKHFAQSLNTAKFFGTDWNLIAWCSFHRFMVSNEAGKE